MNQKIINNKRVVGNKKGSGTILVSALLILTILTIAVNNLAVTYVSAGPAVSPPLGTIATNNLAVLANTLISSAGGAAVITGNVASTGLGTAIGLTCAEVPGGIIYSVDASPVLPCVVHNSAIPTQAQTAWVAANTALMGEGCDVTYAASPADLTGLSLVAGVYCATSFKLTGTLTLTGVGVWVFKTGGGTTLVTSGTANVVGGDPCNVWWQLGSAATLGSGTQLIGNILANAAIGMATGANLIGRALSHTAAVTLDHNHITLNCPPVTFTTITSTVITTVISNSTTVITTDVTLPVTAPATISDVGGYVQSVNKAQVLSMVLLEGALGYWWVLAIAAIVALAAVLLRRRSS